MLKIATGASVVVALLAATAAAGPAPTTPPASADKQPAKTASVHGSAGIFYIESPDHDIRFTVHAEQKPFTRPLPPNAPRGLSTDAWGTLEFSHTSPDGTTGWARAEVDCLVTSGRTATLTAVVTKSNVEEIGTRLGVSVQQGEKGEPDRLGFSWGVVNVDPQNVDQNGELVMPRTGTCMAPAPFTTVIKGGFKVVHADIRKTPA
ncbi:hypothetical protein ABT093_06560 [Kitasatospora sp. NPDC002551]|uniref:hypothetical protein n=1 Tax=unclassified Kitasatospora TaxID=2633591 RepID=UPI00332059B1